MGGAGKGDVLTAAAVLPDVGEPLLWTQVRGRGSRCGPRSYRCYVSALGPGERPESAVGGCETRRPPPRKRPPGEETAKDAHGGLNKNLQKWYLTNPGRCGHAEKRRQSPV